MQEIYFRDMNLSIKIKVLGFDEVETLRAEKENLSKVDYMLRVLDSCVFNLRTEIYHYLQSVNKDSGDDFLKELYNGCVMLNPGLDIETWVKLAQSYDFISNENVVSQNFPFPNELVLFQPLFDQDVSLEEDEEPEPQPKKVAPFKISKSKFLGLKKYLSENVIGQQEAIDEVVKVLKINQAGLKDPNRPLGVFLFSGSSGTGKSEMAKAIHRYLFDGKSELVRIDCGEFQQKHENQKLIGSSAGYVGYEEGGQLTESIKKNPQTVLLLDEAEKAHPDIWNTFLNVFDEGYIVDNKGEHVSFKDVIIILTSNLGNDKVSEDIYGKSTGFLGSIDGNHDTKAVPKREAVVKRVNEAIHKYFKPELINRLDARIVFNHLTEEDYIKIANLELQKLADRMSNLHYTLMWSKEVLELLTKLSGKSQEGARSIIRARRDYIEEPLSDILLVKRQRRGTIFNIDVENDKFVITHNGKG